MDTMKRNNIYIMEISRGEEQWSGSVFKMIMTKIFPNLGKEIARFKRPKRCQIGQYILSVKAKEIILKTVKAPP